MTETNIGEAGRETQRLAAFCSSIDGSTLSEEVRSEVGTAVLDTIGACVAGIDTPESERVRAYVRAASPDGSVPILGTDEYASPEFAALANGTSMHALEVDDGHRGASAHPGAAVIPAALAVISEAENTSGEEFIAAVAGGYEAMLKTGMSVQPSHRKRHFHATATLGCFGAAVAAGRLLALDEEALTHAIGLAGTQAGGLFEFLEDGSMAKRFHPGRAAMSGIMAARLAAEGFDGPQTIIEGKDGFTEAFADEYDPIPLAELGEPFEVTRTYRKPYPCCRHLHAAVDASVAIRKAGLDPVTVETIEVRTYSNAAKHDKVDIKTTLDAQMSMPHAVATALVSGVEDRSAFSDPLVGDEIEPLRQRIRVIDDPEMDAQYPETRSTRVIVHTNSKQRYEETVTYPLGSPENPLSSDRIESKFHDLTASRLSEKKRNKVIELTDELSSVDSLQTLAAAACP